MHFKISRIIDREVDLQGFFMELGKFHYMNLGELSSDIDDPTLQDLENKPWEEIEENCSRWRRNAEDPFLLEDTPQTVAIFKRSESDLEEKIEYSPENSVVRAELVEYNTKAKSFHPRIKLITRRGDCSYFFPTVLYKALRIVYGDDLYERSENIELHTKKDFLCFVTHKKYKDVGIVVAPLSNGKTFQKAKQKIEEVL